MALYSYGTEVRLSVPDVRVPACARAFICVRARASVRECVHAPVCTLRSIEKPVMASIVMAYTVMAYIVMA